MRGVNAQILFSCTEYNSEDEDSFLMIYDRLDTLLNGRATTVAGSNIVVGDSTLYRTQLKAGDIVLINNIRYIVSKIENNMKFTTTKPILGTFVNILIYKTSSENSNIEMLING
jgi:3-phosphoglycerate kinase